MRNLMRFGTRALQLTAVAATLGAARRMPAQSTETRGAAQQLSLQFAVPASPAFKLVEVGATSILRPQSFQQLSASLGGLASGGIQLPRQIGIEVAPFFLAKARDITLSEYRAHAMRYRFRVSAAVDRGADAAGSASGGASDLAVGLRFAPVDASDPRTNDAVVRRVTRIDSTINALCSRSARAGGPPTDETQVGVVSCSGPMAKALMHQLEQAWVDSNWNNKVVELALAGAARTRDSLGRDPRFRTASAWLSAAWPVQRWGQFVGGLNATLGRDSIDSAVQPVGTAGLGFYVGSNRYKGFVEAQGSLKESKGGAHAALGSELFLAQGLWAHFTAGWELAPGETKGRLVSRLTLRTKFPFATPQPSGGA